MPLQPPPITPSFLSAVAACGYNADISALTPASGTGVAYPSVGSNGAWVVDATGDHLTHDTYLLLKNGTANADGSFTSGGVSYWLANSRGWAVPETK